MEAMVALVMAIVVIFFPVAYVWCLTIGGIKEALRGARLHRGGTKAAAAKPA